uniref:peptidylprolyl isomerase n=1 Tax=Ditylenchus dipsaci TaxID=166011 RepID=A0A915E237_9BILA
MLAAEELTKDGGVVKTIIKPGQPEHGTPLKGDTVFVHYVGTLKETGEKFDSSRDRNEPFKFNLGTGKVIKGWDVGVATMHKGEVADLQCTAKYAYGAKLLDWEGEDISPDRDSAITKSIIVKGEEDNCPSETAKVKVHAVGQHNGRTFYDKEIEALRRVNKGEKCKVVLKGNTFNYGSHAPKEFDLPVNADVTFTLFLKDFEKLKASWELTDAERLELAQVSKDRGTKFLNEGKLQLALTKYSHIATLLEHSKPQETEEFGEKFENMFIAGQLNCSLVNLKMNETAECIKNCEKVLEKNPKHVKALYRKAQALQQRKDYDEAISVYHKVSELDPDSKAALQQIAACKEALAQIKLKERKCFAGMFDKMAKQSA